VPFKTLGRAAGAFSADRGTQLAASISYYTFFSLFPLTLLVVSLFGIVLRNEELQLRVLDAIVDFLPIESATVETSIRNVADLGPTLTVFSFLGTAWAAAALSASVRSALNVVFGTSQRRPFLRAKAIDYALLPIIGLPLLGGVVISGVISFAQEELLQWSPTLYELVGFSWGLVALVIPLLLTFIAFIVIYWLLPNRPLQFRYLWPGALFAAVAFELLKAGFTFYLTNFGTFDVVYGSLASVTVLLFWIFLTANILILGAEIGAELPGVLYEDPDEAPTEDGEQDWKRSVWKLVLGLVMVVEEDDDPDEPPGRSRRQHVTDQSDGGTGGPLPGSGLAEASREGADANGGEPPR
jgi:membrane protein